MARRDRVPSRPRSTAMTTTTVQFLNGPIQELFDHDRNYIVKRIDATHTSSKEDKITDALQILVIILAVLARNIIPKSDRAKSHKTKIIL